MLPKVHSIMKTKLSCGALSVVSMLILAVTLSAADAHRYAEEEVHILQRVAPTYPVIAHQIHLSGVVVLDLNVDEEGKVDATETVSGNPILAGGAITAAKRWKFAPIMEEGKPAKATVRVAFKFSDH
jgi:TonB family protein